MFLLELSCFIFSSCMEIVEAHVYNLESSLIVTMFITNSAEVWVFQDPVRSSLLYRFWEVKNMPSENSNLHSAWLNVTSVWLFGFDIKCICKLLTLHCSDIKMIKQSTSHTSYLLCVMLHVSVFKSPSTGLLTNQVSKCWLRVGIPTMFTINTSILYLADKCTKFKR
jgi:hypothetical protein